MHPIVRGYAITVPLRRVVVSSRHHRNRYIHPILLTFALYANYIAHTIFMIKGEEKFTPWKLLLPLQIYLMVNRWGWYVRRLLPSIPLSLRPSAPPPLGVS